MLEQLKFVAGAVAKKDFLPAMTHFVIENGFVRSFNGTLAICSPIPIDINCKPKALTMVKAIGQCKDASTTTMAMTPAGRLSIKNGSFRALIECVEESAVHVMPEGDIVEIDGKMMVECFKVLEPFIGDDASRPWSNGILFQGMSAFATCNVVLVERWLGVQFPRNVVIPLSAVREVLRVGEPPTHAQCTDKSFTFHYSDGRWIRTQLLDPTAWPQLDKILNRDCKPVPLADGMFDGLATIKPFADKELRVYFNGSVMSTHTTDEEGARMEVEGMDMIGVYAIDMLQLLQGVATKADFTAYPGPCAFFGEMIRGVIIGRKA